VVIKHRRDVFALFGTSGEREDGCGLLAALISNYNGSVVYTSATSPLGNYRSGVNNSYLIERPLSSAAPWSEAFSVRCSQLGNRE